MSRKWTDEQESAINARNTGLIVSAAAGSGKTSVLVERLLRQISSSENKIPADKIVVVTFTNDAASEMKTRLITALSEQIEKEPDNKWLFEQQSLLQNANISTIHSFCFNLIRDNIQSLDISSGFRIIDESEEDILLNKSIDEVIEELCTENLDMVKRLTDFFCTKGTYQLNKTIKDFYSFVVTIPYFEDWLSEKINLYSDNISDKDYLNTYKDFIVSSLQKVRFNCSLAQKQCDAIEQTKASEFLKNEEEKIDSVISSFKESDSFSEDLVNSLSDNNIFDSLRFTKVEKNSDEQKVIDSIKKIRDDYKKQYKKIIDDYLLSETQINQDKSMVKQILSDLSEVIYKLDNIFNLAKNEVNGITFSDAERLTIKLLSYKDENGKIKKTKLAEELSEYYKVIMIDEFQDANNSQDLIFKMLSHNGTSEKYGDNVFIVGDIKQSIYRFRLANPKIFIDTLAQSDKYSKDYFGKNAYIKLNKNFRSSKQVVDFVNFIFSNIMSEEVGEVDYNIDEELIQGADIDVSDTETEVILINDDSEDKETNDTLNTDETIKEEENEEVINEEAKAVANKINSMLSNKTLVLDNGIARPCIPSDFCILLRNKAAGELFSKALNKFGILAHTDDISGYLKSREIDILINMLKVIDNPLLDIPLAAVLMSPIFGLDSDDMARIRLHDKSGNLYKALCISIGAIEEESVDLEKNKTLSFFSKAEYFYNTLKNFRMLAAGYTIEKLIKTIYDRTDFLSVVQLYKDGEQKRANLRLLIQYAKNYDENQNGGLSGFIKYLNAISQNGGDLKKAGTVAKNNGVVSVKTIHKSKGLEFPFVFLCRTSSNFNLTDLNNQIQINLSDGIGLKIQDKKHLKRYVTMPYIAIRENNRRNSLSEEMRLLYVALTRAKQKLFITLDLNKKSITKLNYIANNIETNCGITDSLISSVSSMQEWLEIALLTHPDAVDLRDYSKASSYPINNSSSNIVFTKFSDSDFTEKAIKNKKEYDDKIIENNIKIIKSNLQIEKDEKENVLSKMSVTELSKSNNDILLRTPKFLSGINKLSGAEKGTALHTFMQYANFSNAIINLDDELKRLIENGLLTQVQADSIQKNKINSFFKSGLFARMNASIKVMREKKFLIKISDLKIDDDFLSEYKNTDTMIQGIADCIFEENDGFVLVDYKTDYANNESELIEKYSKQLKLYEYAFDEILGNKIKEINLYSFSLEKSIKL